MSDATIGLLTLLKWVDVPEPVTEYRFLPGRQFRFDIAWPYLSLAVEVEGGVWTGGRHVRGAGFERDVEKYNEAALYGWTVLRVTPRMIDDGRAVAWVERGVRMALERVRILGNPGGVAPRRRYEGDR